MEVDVAVPEQVTLYLLESTPVERWFAVCHGRPVT